jgi:cyclopropane fatty-acyl-phospholipid synthase-like methyltransferase
MQDNNDPKRLVAFGYDQIADAYLGQFGHSTMRQHKLSELLHGLPPHAHVLDLGCGAGLPVARDLIAQGFKITGIDGSARQIERARQNAPEAQFIHADMTAARFRPASFEGVGAFYSITHVPRDEHPMLLKHIANWLTPGGRFVGSFGTTAVDSWTGEWLGVTMFFSHHDMDMTKHLIADAGLVIENAEILQQDNEDVQFLWITAHKP